MIAESERVRSSYQFSIGNFTVSDAGLSVAEFESS